MTSPRASASGLPISSVINSANSSARAVMAINARRRISPRSRGAVAAQSDCAATAASRAAAPSAIVASATEANVRPVEGSSTSKVRPSLLSRHFPPMNKPVGTRASRDFSESVNAMGTAFRLAMRLSVIQIPAIQIPVIPVRVVQGDHIPSKTVTGS